jgi:hypothetical protein
VANKSPKRPRVPEGKFLLQVFIDRDLHRKFKARCAERGVTMAEQMKSLINKFLKEG